MMFFVLATFPSATHTKTFVTLFGALKFKQGAPVRFVCCAIFRRTTKLVVFTFFVFNAAPCLIRIVAMVS